MGAPNTERISDAECVSVLSDGLLLDVLQEVVLYYASFVISNMIQNKQLSNRISPQNIR